MRLSAALAIVIGMTSAAFASEGFDLVIPGRPGVPIIVNGIDVSYAVVEGDFGLGKGVNNLPTTIFGGRYVEPLSNVGHYYPSLGLKPGYGRLEIEPPANRLLPHPAEAYHDSWSAQSAPTPAQPMQSEVPFFPPPIIMAPRGDDDDRKRNDFFPPQDSRRKPRKMPY
jgi:hypothetical protein